MFVLGCEHIDRGGFECGSDYVQYDQYNTADECAEQALLDGTNFIAWRSRNQRCRIYTNLDCAEGDRIPNNRYILYELKCPSNYGELLSLSNTIVSLFTPVVYLGFPHFDSSKKVCGILTNADNHGNYLIRLLITMLKNL